jgi:hypothetical protein
MTFNPALLTARDRIRSRIDDADVGNEFFPDATYDARITQYASDTNGEALALRVMALTLITKLSRKPTRAQLGDGVGFEWAERIRALREVVFECDQLLGLGPAAYADAVVSGADPYSILSGLIQVPSP